MTGPALLFADLETDGLGDADILEIGLRVTDSELRTLAERSWVLPWPAFELADMRDAAKPLVRDMHDASGLWVECSRAWDASTSRAGTGVMRRTYLHCDIADEVRAFVVEHAPGKLPMAGSSVRADREWLTRFVPGLDDLLHYRIVDVSSVKILMGLWAEKRLAGGPASRKIHRVMPDLDDTIQELSWYRSILGLEATSFGIRDEKETS